MTTATSNVSDLLITTKSREVQRAESAEARGDRTAATRHFLAAAHMELVLSSDYAESGREDLAQRSRLGAASCFWRGGHVDEARQILLAIADGNGEAARQATELLDDLSADHPAAT